MIPQLNIIAWAKTAPWAEQRQVEQDLVISRALVAIFGDPFLSKELRFRGGTALNKLFFPKPLRYSEDIDLTRTTSGPIGPILDKARAALEPWLGKANFEQSEVAPKLIFRVPAEGLPTTAAIRLKIEISTRETMAYEPTQTIPFRVENAWFTGKADIPTFSREEILATKLRALLQRNKGRDIVDLAHAIDIFQGLDVQRVIDCFGHYLKISRAQAEERMFGKLDDRQFLADVRPLLSADAAEAFDKEAEKQAFERVFSGYIAKLRGKPWAKSQEMRKHFDLTENSDS